MCLFCCGHSLAKVWSKHGRWKSAHLESVYRTCCKLGYHRNVSLSGKLHNQQDRTHFRILVSKLTLAIWKVDQFLGLKISLIMPIYNANYCFHYLETCIRADQRTSRDQAEQRALPDDIACFLLSGQASSVLG